MMDRTTHLEHEEVHVARGERTGATVVLAVHSTALGQAIGGCRWTQYPTWQDGLADALRLSEAMTWKTALAGLDNGGGKTVVVAPADTDRADLFADVGDLVGALGGRYATGPDVGTGPAEMALVHRRTEHVFYGSGGDSSGDTALGTLEALRATAAHLYGDPDLHGRRVVVIGLGRVGARLADALTTAGAELSVTDVLPGARATAARLGARWLEPADALTAPADLLVPAALGGLLTVAAAGELRCAAVVGPANNQLATDDAAEAMHAAGVLWVPDHVVSAGGIIGAVARQQQGATDEQARDRVRAVGRSVAGVLRRAAEEGRSPHRVAQQAARERVAVATRRPEAAGQG